MNSTAHIPVHSHRFLETRHYVRRIMNFVVMLLSLGLIVWISIDTFEKRNFLEDNNYMTYQLWVCIIFIIDFFLELYFSDNKGHTFRSRFLFLLLSIPYLNIISITEIPLSADALYFIRFVPLARGALALSIVMSYLSRNAISSLFLSYLTIMIFTTYFCSLIFFQREYGVNPQVNTYWTALWWTAMNMSTVGCSISPMTVAGKIVAVVLPITGMIMFPLFTVYLTDFVTRQNKQTASSAPSAQSAGAASNQSNNTQTS